MSSGKEIKSLNLQLKVKTEIKLLSHWCYLQEIINSIRDSLFLPVENIKLGLGTAHSHIILQNISSISNSLLIYFALLRSWQNQATWAKRNLQRNI